MSGQSTVLPDSPTASPGPVTTDEPSVWSTLRHWVATDSLNLVLALSLVLLILCSDKSASMLVLGIGACGLALWQPQLCRSPWFWLALSLGQAIRNLAAWITLDDHIYVANYWSLAIALALMTPQPREFLRHNGRWLIGLIFLNPLLGAAVGAAAGAASGALTDIGINNEFMKKIATGFKPGTSALFVLVREATPDKVMDEIKGYGGTVLQTSLSHEKEELLQAALNEAKSGTTV